MGPGESGLLGLIDATSNVSGFAASLRGGFIKPIAIGRAAAAAKLFLPKVNRFLMALLVQGKQLPSGAGSIRDWRFIRMIDNQDLKRHLFCLQVEPKLAFERTLYSFPFNLPCVLS